MRIIKILIPILFLGLFACQEKVKELPGAAPVAIEEKSKGSIFKSDNVDFKEVTSLEKYRDSLSYAIGYYLANSFSQQDLKINPTVMAQGYMDVIENEAGLSHRSAKNYITKTKNIQAYRTKAKAGEFPFPLSLDSVSYALGIDMGFQQKGTNFELNIDPFHQGLVDNQTGAKRKMTEKQQDGLMGFFFKGMREVIKERNKNKTGEEKKESDFFDEIRNTPGMTRMPSGLLYETIRAGTGPKATYTDKVLINYEAKSIDGEVLDNKFKKGTPASVTVSKMIPGWVEGLQFMNKGAKFRFYIPSALAYGEKGYQNIPPNTALIYEIELVDILGEGVGNK